MSEQLALPAGGQQRESHVLNLGTLLLGGAGAMVFGGLLAAYLQLRGVADRWPPEDVHLDNYLGVMLFLTAVLSAVTVEWAPYAIKRGNQRQTLWALTLTIGLGLAFLNLLWYTASQLGFGVADHAFGTLVYAAILAIGVQMVLGLGYVLVALVRTGGHQVVPGDHQLVRAAGWYWQWVNVCWLVAFTGFYVLQNR
ncbi:MAG: cytochrome c oxidase subunit [Actinomycetota bacterium]|jgi:cytochrome c oxidase subunit 3